MSSMTLALLLQASLLAATADSSSPQYAEAYQESAESGRPLLVLVGADWCPACERMKSSVIPQVRQRGGLKKIAFATVNTDQHSALASKLMSGGSIPQLILYRKTSAGWERHQLTGAQSPSSVQEFIDRGVETTVFAKQTTPGSENHQ